MSKAPSDNPYNRAAALSRNLSSYYDVLMILKAAADAEGVSKGSGVSVTAVEAFAERVQSDGRIEFDSTVISELIQNAFANLPALRRWERIRTVKVSDPHVDPEVRRQTLQDIFDELKFLGYPTCARAVAQDLSTYLDRQEGMGLRACQVATFVGDVNLTARAAQRLMDDLEAGHTEFSAEVLEAMKSVDLRLEGSTWKQSPDFTGLRERFREYLHKDLVERQKYDLYDFSLGGKNLRQFRQQDFQLIEETADYLEGFDEGETSDSLRVSLALSSLTANPLDEQCHALVVMALNTDAWMSQHAWKVFAIERVTGFVQANKLAEAHAVLGISQRLEFDPAKEAVAREVSEERLKTNVGELAQRIFANDDFQLFEGSTLYDAVGLCDDLGLRTQSVAIKAIADDRAKDRGTEVAAGAGRS